MGFGPSMSNRKSSKELSHDVTRILNEIEAGNPEASEQLLPLVYEELRKLAAAKLTEDRSPPSLQPTVLVHDAYIRLVDQREVPRWNGRGHFFGAAAEAMRRILVEHARQRASLKRGGHLQRVEFDEDLRASSEPPMDLLALDEALQELEQESPQKANLVKLRFFAGLSVAETAQILGISTTTAERHWRFARTWLFARLNPDS